MPPNTLMGMGCVNAKSMRVGREIEGWLAVLGEYQVGFLGAANP